MMHASAIGSTFDGRIVAETRRRAAGDRAGDPRQRVDHRRHSCTIDPDDPFPEGYLLSDTWGVSGLDSQS